MNFFSKLFRNSKYSIKWMIKKKFIKKQICNVCKNEMSIQKLKREKARYIFRCTAKKCRNSTSAIFKKGLNNFKINLHLQFRMVYCFVCEYSLKNIERETKLSKSSMLRYFFELRKKIKNYIFNLKKKLEVLLKKYKLMRPISKRSQDIPQVHLI